MQKDQLRFYTLAKNNWKFLNNMIHNSTKIIKHLEENVTKDIYLFNTWKTENHKALLRDIREDPNKERIHEWEDSI